MAIERAEEARRMVQPKEEPQSKFPRLVGSSTDTSIHTLLPKQQPRPYTCPAKPSPAQQLPRLSQRCSKSKKSRGQTNILTILPPIRETPVSAKNLPPELADSVYRKCISVNPATPEHDTTEVYRKQHRFVIAALASNSSAGNPFQDYLLTCGVPSANGALAFWKECHVYLALQRTLPDSGDVQDHIRFRRARMLIVQHLLSNSELPVNLAPSMKESLVCLLRQDKADGLLQHAQNTVTTVGLYYSDTVNQTQGQRNLLLNHLLQFCFAERTMLQLSDFLY